MIENEILVSLSKEESATAYGGGKKSTELFSDIEKRSVSYWMRNCQRFHVHSPVIVEIRAHVRSGGNVIERISLNEILKRGMSGKRDINKGRVTTAVKMPKKWKVFLSEEDREKVRKRLKE